MTMKSDDTKYCLILTVCALVIFALGFLAGSFNPYSPLIVSDDRAVAQQMYVSMPENCTNPVYVTSDNYWYCEVV